MDQQNQVINPTLQKKRANSARCAQNRDMHVEQPATTAKHDARVAKTREKIQGKIAEEEKQFKSDVDRLVKQTRLEKRVKCSPALVSNGLTLAKKR